MSRPFVQVEPDPAARLVARVLGAGVAASLALMALGAALSLLRGEALPDRVLPLSGLLAGAAALEPGALMSLGLAVLLATPAARVIALAWQFARRREWRFLAVSLGVLAVLAFSVAVGRAH